MSSDKDYIKQLEENIEKLQHRLDMAEVQKENVIDKEVYVYMVRNIVDNLYTYLISTNDFRGGANSISVGLSTSKRYKTSVSKLINQYLLGDSWAETWDDVSQRWSPVDPYVLYTFSFTGLYPVLLKDSILCDVSELQKAIGLRKPTNPEVKKYGVPE